MSKLKRGDLVVHKDVPSAVWKITSDLVLSGYGEDYFNMIVVVNTGNNKQYYGVDRIGRGYPRNLTLYKEKEPRGHPLTKIFK